MTAPSYTRLQRLASGWPMVALLLVLYWLMAVSATRQKCTSYDEIAHLTGGYSYWRYNDYRLGNGVFLQRWATIPLVGSSLRFPSLGDPAWQKSHVFEVGHQFFYLSGNPPDAMLLWARAMSALLGVALGLLVYLWSRNLFGPAGGLLSLGLFAFCPTLLGNGPLVKADVAASLFFLLSAWAWWRLLHKVSIGTVSVSALAVAGLFLCKMSALLFVVMAALIAGARLLSNQPTLLCLGRRQVQLTRLKLLGVLAVSLLAHVVVAVMLVWASFGFRYSVFDTATPGVDQLDPSWEAVLDTPGPVTEVIALARRLEVLPEAFLYDFAFTYRNTQVRSAFLNGEHSLVGWPTFFPYAFFLKTPLPVFLLFGFAVLALISRRRAPGLWYHTVPLWIFLAVYWGFSIRSHINIGHRHLLPTYPVMYILAGGAAWWLGRKHLVASVAVVASAVWMVSLSLWIRPHYLAYFNEWAGGPRQGYRHLVDSSLDWGQDLPGLKAWLAREGLDGSGAVVPVYLSYFGTGDPVTSGISAYRLPGEPDINAEYDLEPLRGGVYCVSATTLQQVYSSFSGPWAVPYEERYQDVLHNLQLFQETIADPQGRQRLLESAEGDFWYDQFNLYTRLRFARLCAYLRQREPDDNVGYSILIYRLSDLQVEEALFGAPAELVPAIQVKGSPL